jgi:long-chain acyl-CoA synthetase
MIRPFDQSCIVRGEDGIARYQNRPRSLIEMLRATVDRTPLNEAVVELGGERVNYRELWDRAARVSGGLKSQGIGRGDRVAIRLGNSLDWCVAFWGSLMSGAVVVPVNTRFSEPEIEYVVTDSGSRFAFLPDQPLPSGDPFVAEDLEQPDVAAIFYTSGTTGFPKGAMTTHEGFLSNCETCKRIVPLPSDGSVRTLVSVPLFHVTGCNSQLLTSCETGGGSVIMRGFDVQAFLRAIVEERITSVTSVPAIFWLAISQPNFSDFNMQGVRWAMYGGAPIAPDLVGRIMEAFPNARVGNGFGLTETSSVATFLPHEYSSVRPDTVGFAAPVVDLELFETDSGGVGELLVRGPNVVKGYWNKPEATAQTFVNGWLHTGDLARIDADGFVQIVDRKKDMVNRGGENVYCVEVENALCAHPAVYECAVMGVPDTMMGEKVGAVVVLKPGVKAEPAAICEFLKGRVADFKIPQFLTIRLDPLPRNPGGKILKPRLRTETAWGKSLR